MDASPEYIKMCEKAVALQSLHKVDKSRDEWYEYIPRTDVEDMVGGFDWNKAILVWLPRQDQLQEMVGGYHEDEHQHVSLLHNFDTFLDFLSVPNPYHSMEQLWLGFVMHEKYKKHWNGEDWVDSPGFQYVQDAANFLDDAPVPLEGRIFDDEDGAL